jgi:hypothetical protein
MLLCYRLNAVMSDDVKKLLLELFGKTQIRGIVISVADVGSEAENIWVK